MAGMFLVRTENGTYILQCMCSSSAPDLSVMIHSSLGKQSSNILLKVFEMSLSINLSDLPILLFVIETSHACVPGGILGTMY